MADERAGLLALLESFLRGTLDFRGFQSEFEARWLEAPEAALTDFDHLFFDEVHEQSEWTTPGPVPRVEREVDYQGEDEFRAWLESALPQYRNGTFQDDWTWKRARDGTLAPSDGRTVAPNSPCEPR